MSEGTVVLGRVRAIAFDCFGTLADMHDGHFIDVMGVIALEHELGLEGKDLWERWLAIGREVWTEMGRDWERPTQGPEPRFGTYMELWTEQFRRSFEALQKPGDAEGSYARMVERLRDAEPYPEVHEVLAALRGRYRLCLLSNADDDWLYPFVERSGLEFELIVSSESARSYKPRGRIFLETCERMGVAPAEMLYVGDTPLADVLGANHAGLPVAWVNRYGAIFPEKLPRPDLEIKDLRGLLDALP